MGLLPSTGRERWQALPLELGEFEEAAAPSAVSQSRAPSAETLELLDKQLGRYEAVIQRYSAQAKTWCVTLVAAIAALAANNERPTILGLGVVAAVGFLFLDAYYLSSKDTFAGPADALVDEAGADQPSIGRNSSSSSSPRIGEALRFLRPSHRWRSPRSTRWSHACCCWVFRERLYRELSLARSRIVLRLSHASELAERVSDPWAPAGRTPSSVHRQ